MLKCTVITLLFSTVLIQSHSSLTHIYAVCFSVQMICLCGSVTGCKIGVCTGVQKSLEIIGSTPQGHTRPEHWQLWPIVGGAGNGATEEDRGWDLNPGNGSHLVSLFGTTRPFGTTWL